METLVSHDCAHVKLQTFSALLWSEPRILGEQTVNRIKIEIKSNELWMPFHLHELMCTLFDYACINPSVFTHLTDIIIFVCTKCIDRINVSLMMELFEMMVSVSKKKGFRSQLLRMLFTILDRCMTGSIVSVNLAFSINSFIGEHANRLASEPSLDKEVVNKEMLNPDRSMSLQELVSRPEIFDIQNLAMKSIVLRLVHSSMFSAPQIRGCCVEALGKIAFRSLDATRLYVYECLRYLASIEEFGVHAQCANIIEVLDDLFELQQYFLKLRTREHTSEELAHFFEVHERTKQKISFYCRFHPSFMPLGPSSRELLNESFAMRKKLRAQHKPEEDPGTPGTESFSLEQVPVIATPQQESPKQAPTPSTNSLTIETAKPLTSLPPVPAHLVQHRQQRQPATDPSRDNPIQFKPNVEQSTTTSSELQQAATHTVNPPLPLLPFDDKPQQVASMAPAASISIVPPPPPVSLQAPPTIDPPRTSTMPAARKRRTVGSAINRNALLKPPP